MTYPIGNISRQFHMRGSICRMGGFMVTMFLVGTACIGQKRSGQESNYNRL